MRASTCFVKVPVRNKNNVVKKKQKECECVVCSRMCILVIFILNDRGASHVHFPTVTSKACEVIS